MRAAAQIGSPFRQLVDRMGADRRCALAQQEILKGFDAITAMPLGMFSGPAFGYDPTTATLNPIGGDLTSSYHLVTIFGGAEIVNEILGTRRRPEIRSDLAEVL